jgi:hypothetical protein
VADRDRRVKAQDSYLPFFKTKARYLKATKKPEKENRVCS